MPELMTGGDAMVKATLRHGVDTIFALPGVQTYPLIDALQRVGDDIRRVGARHEQGAAYMAYGYAKATGRPGVFSVVPGPGVLNAGAAMCTATAGCAPILCLTGDIPAPFLGKGRGHLHELPDQLATLSSFIKWAGRAENTAEAPGVIDAAFAHMLGGKPGPVAVEMCWDEMAEQAPVTLQPAPARPALPAIDGDAIAAAASLIAKAKRPMIMCGSGAQHASDAVRALAELLTAPVTALRSGRGVVSEDHELGISSAAAWELWAETDLLIGIGSRCELQYMRWNGMMTPEVPADGPALIRIDIDPDELGRLPADVAILGDAAQATAELVNAASGPGKAASADAINRIATARRIARAKVETVQPHVGYLDVIRDVLPRDGLFIKDICQSGFASYFAFPVYEPRTYITSGYQGNLGYGFPTALGAKVGRPDRPAVAIVGDGGFGFAMQELSTMANENIGLTIILFNNQAFGNVKRDQQQRFNSRTVLSDLPGPSYATLAEHFGVAGYRADSPASLRPVLARALENDAPALIEVMLDLDDETSPWPYIMPPPRD